MIYMAGPLFTSAQREWNILLAHNLEVITEHTVMLPQVFCEGVTDPNKISNLCLHQLTTCDIVVVCCDGVDVDSGTAMECGVAVERDLKIIAYRTDFRRAGDCNKNINLMIAEQAAACLIMPLANYAEVGRAIAGTIKRWENEN